MAGRIRSVKPEWLEDERLVAASAAARVLSIALILMADDFGSGRANLVMTAAKVFPFEADPVAVCSVAMAELERINFVILYEKSGQTYFQVRNWEKHQRVEKRGDRRVPAPPKELNESGLLAHFLRRVDDESTTPPLSVDDSSATPPLSLATDLDLDLDQDHDQEIPESPRQGPAPSAGSDEPALLGLSVQGPPKRQPVDEVFAAYVDGWKRHVGAGRPPLFTHARRKAIQKRRKDGHDWDQLRAAAAGIWHSEWHIRERRTDFDLVFRDTEHVEKFASLAPITPTQPATAAPEPPAAPTARLQAFMAARGAPESENVTTGQPDALAGLLAGIGRRAS